MRRFGSYKLIEAMFYYYVHSNRLLQYTFTKSTEIRVLPQKKARVDWKIVGRRLRQLRGFDINQSQFARAIGVSQGQLSRYEKGESEIGAEVLLRIAERTGKSMEWLLTGKET